MVDISVYFDVKNENTATFIKEEEEKLTVALISTS